jgi:hypothetical protein
MGDPALKKLEDENRLREIGADVAWARAQETRPESEVASLKRELSDLESERRRLTTEGNSHLLQFLRCLAAE